MTEPADQLALDEAMLLAADEGECAPAMRIWEFARHVVVAGRSTRVHEELDIPYCQAEGIPVLRRCSGGASVVGGPGCLMYSVVLNVDREPSLRKIDVAHQHVMGLVLRAVRAQAPEANLNGTCDLTLGDRKCSGNALRIARHHLLYHGTILYDFDLPLIGKCLRAPPRQPEYRGGRDHASFLTNLAIDTRRFAEDICELFGAAERDTGQSLAARIRSLRQQRYDCENWNFRH